MSRRAAASIGRTAPTTTATSCWPPRQSFDSRNPGDLVIFFHGNEATLTRDVVERQQAPRQLANSGLNGVLIAPQMAVDALDSSAGRFWQPGALAAFLDEADSKLAALYPDAPRGAFRRMPVILVAYSGGYLPVAFSLAHGGAAERIRGVVLHGRALRRAGQVRRLDRAFARSRVFRQRLFEILA